MKFYIEHLLREKRISVIMDGSITEMKGVTKLEEIHFKNAEHSTEEHFISGD
jgi:hypothetical protein